MHWLVKNGISANGFKAIADLLEAEPEETVSKYVNAIKWGL